LGFIHSTLEFRLPRHGELCAPHETFPPSLFITISFAFFFSLGRTSASSKIRVEIAADPQCNPVRANAQATGAMGEILHSGLIFMTGPLFLFRVCAHKKRLHWKT
jgi:hypothetical protein